MNSSWSEVSLGSDQTQEGHLQFRRGSRSASEWESVCEERNQTSRNQDTEDEKENDKKKAIENPADSSAYRYGIKFVYGAASLVSNMADGGKTNRKLIKQLRIELDESRKKCDELERQANNLKQWIAYYENLNGGLENQVEEIKQQFSSDYALLQEKLKKSELDADSYRKECIKVSEERSAALKNIETTKSALGKMKLQVEKAQKKILEVEEKALKPLSKTPMPNAETQVESEKPLDLGVRPDGNLAQKITEKEAQIRDATAALQLSVSRSDRLRHQLMKSFELMKSQTCEMKQTRVILEASKTETRNLKTLLHEKVQKNKEVEVACARERELKEAAISNLENTKQSLEKTLSELDKEKKLATRNFNAYKTSLDSLKLDHFIDNFVSGAINSAIAIHRRALNSKQLKKLVEDSNKKSNQLKEAENIAQHWINKFDVLEAELRDKENFFHECNEQVHALVSEVNQLKNEIQSKDDVGQMIKSTLAAAEANLAQAKSQHQKALDDKNNAIFQLNILTQQLKEENSQLQLELQQCSYKPTVVSVAVQTDLHSSKVDELLSRATEAETLNENLTQQLNIANEKAAKWEEEFVAQQSSNSILENEIKKLKQMNIHLNWALDESQSMLDAKRYHLWKAEQDCQRLHWECRQQHQRSVEIYYKNLRLQHTLNSYAKSSPHHDISSLAPPSTSHYQTGEYSSRHCSYNHNNVSELKPTGGLPLATIKENDEQTSSPSSNSSLENLPETAATSNNTTTHFPLINAEKTFPSNSELAVAVSSDPQTIIQSSQRVHLKKSRKINNFSNVETDTSTLRTDQDSVDGNNDALHLLPALETKERLVGIPMPNAIFNRIVAGENIQSWQEDHGYSHDDGYSTSSCNSVTNDLRPLQELESADSAISEQIHSNAIVVESELDPHFVVNYKGVEFDMVDLTFSKIRNIASSSGAIATLRNMKDFYDFLSKNVAKMNEIPHLKNAHKLGCASDWLKLKQQM